MLPAGTKTYTGLTILLLPTLARSMGFEISEAEATGFANQMASLIENIMIFGGAILGFYGRWHATRNKA